MKHESVWDTDNNNNSIIDPQVKRSGAAYAQKEAVKA